MVNVIQSSPSPVAVVAIAPCPSIQSALVTLSISKLTFSNSIHPLSTIATLLLWVVASTLATVASLLQAQSTI